MTAWKIVIALASRAEALAASERLALALPDVTATTEFECPAIGGWRVEAYVAAPPEPELVAALLALEPGAVGVEAVPDENWVAVSQAALPPVVAGRFVVHGSHDRSRVGRRQGAIEIDAGEAFGTAHHATTLGCLLALDRLARLPRGQPKRQEGSLRLLRGPRGQPGRVLDLGCGSGVLAIAAAMAWPAAQVLASDIDGEAVAVARANVRANRMGERVRIFTATGLAHPVLRRVAPYDLVVANILAAPLIALAARLAAAIVPGGTAVLSGILAPQSAQVEAAWRAAGFRLAAKRLLNGWAILVLERRPPLPPGRARHGAQQPRGDTTSGHAWSNDAP